ncbi:MAG TPA: hypothetical protein VGK41_05525 [Solirubrobacterales bacterium]
MNADKQSTGPSRQDVAILCVVIAMGLGLVAIWTAPWSTAARAAVSAVCFLAVAIASLRGSR